MKSIQSIFEASKTWYRPNEAVRVNLRFLPGRPARNAARD
jgi:hypothetical protein